MGDIGVIVEMVLDADERDESQYIVVWLYRNYKVVRAYENDITHHGPVDDCKFCYVHDKEFDDDWWKRRPGWEIPPSFISWDSFFDPHTGNLFARGYRVVIEQNYVTSKFHRNMVDVNFGDKCILLDYRYKQNKFYGDIQKQ